MSGSQGSGEESDNPVAINATAMVDVIFCLCLFFMCSFHFKQLEGKIETWLPTGRGIFPGPVPSPLVKPEIVVVMTWDAQSSQTIRRLRHQAPVRSDEELMGAIRQIADSYDKEGKTYPLVIDAEPEVPWRDVVHVMDLCKRNGIKTIELGAPERAME